MMLTLLFWIGASITMMIINTVLLGWWGFMTGLTAWCAGFAISHWRKKRDARM